MAIKTTEAKLVECDGCGKVSTFLKATDHPNGYYGSVSRSVAGELTEAKQFYAHSKGCIARAIAQVTWLGPTEDEPK